MVIKFVYTFIHVLTNSIVVSIYTHAIETTTTTTTTITIIEQ